MNLKNKVKQVRGKRALEAEALWIRADKKNDDGELRSAFYLMLRAAKKGNCAAQNTVGYYYDTGTGVKANRNAAMYWYKRAYKANGSSSDAAANNIGTVYRDEKNTEMQYIGLLAH